MVKLPRVRDGSQGRPTIANANQSNTFTTPKRPDPMMLRESLEKGQQPGPSTTH